VNPVTYQVSPLSSPVPDGFPTSQIYTDAQGNEWQWNPQTSEWVQITAPSGVAAPGTVTPSPIYTANEMAYGYPSSIVPAAAENLSSPVPAGYPTSEIYTDASGNEWEYENGAWMEIASAATLAAGATATSWFSEETIMPGYSNGLVLGGGLAGLLVLYMLTGKRR
jgi:hypothetical protein